VPPPVKAYVKNHNFGIEVANQFESESRKYNPGFIVPVDNSHGEVDLLYLIVEINEYRRLDAKEKKATMDKYWVPHVYNHDNYNRCVFSECSDVYEIQSEFEVES